MPNADIRALIARNRLHYWELAEYVGRCPETICRWMRTELTEERRGLILDAVGKAMTEQRSTDRPDEFGRKIYENAFALGETLDGCKAGQAVIMIPSSDKGLTVLTVDLPDGYRQAEGLRL